MTLSQCAITRMTSREKSGVFATSARNFAVSIL